MFKRILTSAIGLILLFIILLVSSNMPIVLNISLAFICTFCVIELCSALQIKKDSLCFISSIIFSAMVPLVSSSVWPIWIFLYTVFIFVSILKNYMGSFKDILACYALTFLVTMSFACLFLLHSKDTIFYFLLPLVLSWSADTAAYFVGVKKGKTKLCPSLSPHKTVEGFFGGFIVAALFFLIYCLIFQYFVFHNVLKINILNCLFVYTIGNLLSVLGDLSFSAIKRVYCLKDFGDAMPGHGGLMDRFDSVIFLSPFIYLYIHYFKIFS